ncbi:MAG: energy transducer TonB [Fulvivirga sp.]|nr:energy transducer TonB [Fulvivirga sp.]
MLPNRNIPSDPALKVTHKKTEHGKQVEIVEDLIAHKKRSYKQYKANVKLFFSIGMVISLFLIILLFEWKTYDNPEENQLANVGIQTDEIIDIPVTKQPPPPPRQVVQQPNIIEVTEEEIIEEIEVDFDVEITAEETVEEVTPIEMDEPEEEVVEEIFTIVEDKPTPEGGMQAFMKYVGENIDYPDKAKRMGIQGKVFVEFVVDKDGSLTDFKVIKGIGGGCDEEAIRVLKNAPKWNPGKQRGIAVKVRMVMPVFFVLKEV